MQTMAQPSVPGTKGSPSRTVMVGAAICLSVALVLGFALGSTWSSRHQDTWHTGVAYTGSHVVSIELDGWTYGARDSVPQWIDRQGTVHDAGWPDCLAGPGENVPVRFQAREVTVDGRTWRPIVAIDCRAA